MRSINRERRNLFVRNVEVIIKKAKRYAVIKPSRKSGRLLFAIRWRLYVHRTRLLSKLNTDMLKTSIGSCLRRRRRNFARHLSAKFASALLVRGLFGAARLIISYVTIPISFVSFARLAVASGDAHRFSRNPSALFRGEEHCNRRNIARLPDTAERCLRDAFRFEVAAWHTELLVTFRLNETWVNCVHPHVLRSQFLC